MRRANEVSIVMITTFQAAIPKKQIAPSTFEAALNAHIVGGFLWFVYFLWQHDWKWALSTAVLSAVVGRLATSGTKDETLASTLLGRIMLLHLHPMNFSVQIAGFALLFYGIWFIPRFTLWWQLRSLCSATCGDGIE